MGQVINLFWSPTKGNVIFLLIFNDFFFTGSGQHLLPASHTSTLKLLWLRWMLRLRSPKAKVCSFPLQGEALSTLPSWKHQLETKTFLASKLTSCKRKRTDGGLQLSKWFHPLLKQPAWIIVFWRWQTEGFPNGESVVLRKPLFFALCFGLVIFQSYPTNM